MLARAASSCAVPRRQLDCILLYSLTKSNEDASKSLPKYSLDMYMYLPRNSSWRECLGKHDHPLAPAYQCPIDRGRMVHHM